MSEQTIYEECPECCEELNLTGCPSQVICPNCQIIFEVDYDADSVGDPLEFTPVITLIRITPAPEHMS